jgi:pyruvate dehydrogenase E1 component alpha subunit
MATHRARGATLAGLTRPELLDLHARMLLLRRFEERAAEAHALGRVGGYLHLAIGQEATAVGAVGALRPSDYALSGYRALGHALAKGVAPRAVMAELFGKRTGCSKGRGGPMHLYSAEHRLIGGQAIVGAQLTIAVGIGFSIQYRGGEEIALVLFGEGAADGGALYEALNLAALWTLPVVFLCERNRHPAGAEPRAWSTASLEPRAAAHGMPYLAADGSDVLAVRAALGEAAARARAGEGPALIECEVYRLRGHGPADPAHGRAPDEEAQWRATRDPIALFAARLREAGMLGDDERRDHERRADEAVEDALRFAEESAEPDPEELYADVGAADAAAIAWRARPDGPRA